MVLLPRTHLTPDGVWGWAGQWGEGWTPLTSPALRSPLYPDPGLLRGFQTGRSTWCSGGKVQDYTVTGPVSGPDSGGALGSGLGSRRSVR